MSLTESLYFESTISAPPAEAYRAFTHATALRDWLSNDAISQARTRGFIFLYWNDGYTAIWKITQFEPPHSLKLEWYSLQDPGPTHVIIKFVAIGDSVRVELEHAGFGKSPAWEQNRQEKERAWGASLENLESFLLEGVDLRLARRPRLGIWMDELTPSIATSLGLPSSDGVLLAVTTPGSGAHAAGLQKDDVLVSMNNVVLVGPASLDKALKGLHAGDKPIVEYYRGGVKYAVPLELGHFQILPLPENPAALVAELRKTNNRIHTTISQHVVSLSETQASLRPQDNEWSVKELIGHFILTERDYQSWAANMLRDNVVNDNLQFSPNVDERIAALLVRYSTVSLLLEEFAIAQEETASLLASLPEHFVKWRKHLYRRLVGWSLQVTPSHLDEEHASQLAETIKAVRG